MLQTQGHLLVSMWAFILTVKVFIFTRCFEDMGRFHFPRVYWPQVFLRACLKCFYPFFQILNLNERQFIIFSQQFLLNKVTQLRVLAHVPYTLAFYFIPIPCSQMKQHQNEDHYWPKLAVG